jgi:Tfp pilus assembly protein FimT
MRTEAGLTVLELLMTLAIVSILPIIAVPGFTTVTPTTRQMQRSTGYTPPELCSQAAIVRDSYVVMRKSEDGANCNHVLADWNSGWLIFNYLNRDSTVHMDPGETIQRVRGPFRSQTPVVNNRNSFTFRPMEMHSVNVTFRYCSEGVRNEHALIVNVMGQVRNSDAPTPIPHSFAPDSQMFGAGLRNSFGKANTMCSGIPCVSWMVAPPHSPRRATTFCTMLSGAEAPAVTPTRSLP